MVVVIKNTTWEMCVIRQYQVNTEIYNIGWEEQELDKPNRGLAQSTKNGEATTGFKNEGWHDQCLC